MVSCTFFGNRDTPKEIEPILLSTLIDLIENKKVDLFYVGNNGNFDYMVRRNLKKLKLKYTHIRYYVVLAYMPYKKLSENEDYSDSIFPEELSKVYPRFAIVKRNNWMIDRAEYVVIYVKHTTGGAWRFAEVAKKKEKKIIKL